jgi:hypothetical protein
MGWTVLYIAFGIVALWLLGEVLLQYKAKLRWRVLAFAGFVGVVLGVLSASVAVIGLGALAFAVGQTFVTLSFRSGFAEGWALPAARRRAGRDDEGWEEYEGDGRGDRGDRGDFGRQDDERSAPAVDDYQAAESVSAYQPQPSQEDTGSYGVYDNSGYDTGGYPAAASAGADGQQQGYGAYDTYAGTGYDQQQYQAYADPYATQGGQGQYGYDGTYGGQQQDYGQQGGYDASVYGGYTDTTPPGGVWVPQQRGADDPYGTEQPQQEQQPYPYGYDGQYRY